MAYTGRLAWETLRSRDSATFTGSYQTLGTALVNPSYILKLVNNSTVLVTISIDGTTDIDVAPSGSFWLYDEGKVGGSSQIPAIPAGTQIFVKGAAGTGSVYLVSQYIVTN
jgi:hypothetical protein